MAQNRSAMIVSASALVLATALLPDAGSAQTCGIACAVRAPGGGIGAAVRRPEDHVTATCGAHATYTDFIDYPFPGANSPGQCGKVAGNNHFWGALPGGWDNRADAFRNNGTWTNCLYDEPGYRGSRIALAAGEVVDWSDTVSSNAWRQGRSDCQ